jgi:hypothetical protein
VKGDYRHSAPWSEQITSLRQGLIECLQFVIDGNAQGLKGPGGRVDLFPAAHCLYHQIRQLAGGG